MVHDHGALHTRRRSVINKKTKRTVTNAPHPEQFKTTSSYLVAQLNINVVEIYWVNVHKNKPSPGTYDGSLPFWVDTSAVAAPRSPPLPPSLPPPPPPVNNAPPGKNGLPGKPFAFSSRDSDEIWSLVGRPRAFCRWSNMILRIVL